MSRKPPVQFTTEEDAILWRMHAEGKTIKAMSEALNRPYSSTGNRMLLLRGMPPCPSVLALIEKKSPQHLALADQAKTKRKAESLAGVCKCLGGCGKEFLSPDRMRIRICVNCKKTRVHLMHDLREFSLNL